MNPVFGWLIVIALTLLLMFVGGIIMGAIAYVIFKIGDLIKKVVRWE